MKFFWLGPSHRDAERVQDMLSKREEQLRRDKTKLHTKMLQAEHDTESMRAEMEHLKKQIKDLNQANVVNDAKVKQLEEQLKQERTQHMAKVCDS